MFRVFLTGFKSLRNLFQRNKVPEMVSAVSAKFAIDDQNKFCPSLNFVVL